MLAQQVHLFAADLVDGLEPAHKTPPELRGSVSGAATALTSLAQLAAMLLSGMWATHLGIRGVFGLSATLLFAIAANGIKAEHPGTDRTRSLSA